MPKKTEENIDDIKEKLKYIGIEDLEDAKNQFEEYEPLKFKIPKFYEEKQYRQYRYIPIRDIQILLTPTNRLDDIHEKYKNASPITEYLDNQNEENYLKHTTLLVDGKEIKPTSEDVDKVIEYLNQNEIYVCKHTVESTVRQYLKGEIVLLNNEEKQIKLQKKEEEKKKLEKEEEKIDELERLIKRNKERMD